MLATSSLRLRVGLGLGLFTAAAACNGDDATTPASPPPAVDTATASAPPKCPPPSAPPASLAERLGERVATVESVCAGGEPLSRDATRELEVAGKWTGEYDHRGSGTEIVVTLRVHDHHMFGEMDEPNTFAPYGPARLDASITGDVFADGQVVFMKTYASVGVTHSVFYTGALKDGGRRIEGRWRLSSGDTGTFWLAKT